MKLGFLYAGQGSQHPGMGADLYESYSGARLSSMALGVSAGLGFKGMMIPMALCALGIFASIIGSFFVKTEEGACLLYTSPSPRD